MSILAGAIQGLGLGLVKEGQAQKKKALEKWKREQGLEDYQAKLDMKAAAKSGGRSGGVGGLSGALGTGKTGLKLNNQTRDDLHRIHESYKDTPGSYGDNDPSEGQIMAWIETNADPNMSISQAAEAARKAWQGNDTTETVLKDRNIFGKVWEGIVELGSGDGKYEEEVSVPHAGFSKPPSSGGIAAAIAPAQSSGPPQPKSKAEFDALPSGTTYVDPTGVRRTKP